MLGKLDRDERTEPLPGQAVGQESDGACDPPIGAKPSQAPGDRRRRPCDARRELIRRLRIIGLDQIQKGEVEAVEHGPIVPNFGKACTPFARAWQSGSASLDRSSSRQREAVEMVSHAQGGTS